MLFLARKFKSLIFKQCDLTRKSNPNFSTFQKKLIFDPEFLKTKENLQLQIIKERFHAYFKLRIVCPLSFSTFD